MIQSHRGRLRELAFYLGRYTGKEFALVLAFDATVAYLYIGLDWDWIALPHIPLALFGSAIGVLVGFRLSQAYARWWEARVLWGAVVNDSRSLARQVLTYLPEAARRKRIVHLQIAYVHALRLQLRGQDVLAELAPWLDDGERTELSDQRNVALALQQKISVELHATRPRVSEYTAMQIDDTLVRLMNSQGGLERIKNTPMPRQYVNLLRLFVTLYAVLLPFGLIQNLGVMTPIGSSALAIIFFTLNRLGSEIELPFENQPTDIAMTSITTTIEIGLRQLLEESQLPEPTAPVAGVMW